MDPVPEPRVVRADNAGLFTLDGTRTHLVGRERVAVVDPGPDDASHRDRLLEGLRDARRVDLLPTHAHPDHAAGVPALRAALEAADPTLHVRVLGPAGVGTPLFDGDVIETDAGVLRTVETPGHARGHVAFFWEPARALFAGDLLMGEGATAWVGSYRGCVADYLRSLDRVEALAPSRVYPAHGPPIDDPAAALARFRAHRLQRIAQVREAATSLERRDVDRIVARVYGSELDVELREPAAWSVRAILDHLGLRAFPASGPTVEG